MRAVLLAAGLGTRLGGQPKAALRHPAGGTLLERSVAALHAAGVADVRVVLGPYRERLLPLVQASCTRWQRPASSTPNVWRCPSTLPAPAALRRM